jgi:hypothetical protein
VKASDVISYPQALYCFYTAPITKFFVNVVSLELDWKSTVKIVAFLTFQIVYSFFLAMFTIVVLVKLEPVNTFRYGCNGKILKIVTASNFFS